MNLRDYEWFRNPRGLEATGPYSPLELSRYIRPKLGWAKLRAGDTEYLDAARALIDQQCMPIVRVFRENMCGSPVPEAWDDEIYRPYIRQGVRWFELYEEPNLPHSWPQNSAGEPIVDLTPDNTESVIAPLVDAWLDWAERIIVLGGYPAFPALAPSMQPEHATLLWLAAMFDYLADFHGGRFQYIIANGLWLAVHPQIGNRVYQEPPGGPAHLPRSTDQLVAQEPGWHFEYPYDPLQQTYDRGRTVFGRTEQTPYGEPFGLIGVAQMFQDMLRRRFDAGPVPVVGTAGGITPVPKPGGVPIQPDERYPPLDDEGYTQATLALVDWLVRRGPPWFWGIALSNERDMYDVRGTHPVISRWVKIPPDEKTVPDISTGGYSPLRVSAPTPVVERVPETQPEPEPEVPALPDDELYAALDLLDAVEQEAHLQDYVELEDDFLDLLGEGEPVAARLTPEGDVAEPGPTDDLLAIISPVEVEEATESDLPKVPDVDEDELFAIDEDDPTTDRIPIGDVEPDELFDLGDEPAPEQEPVETTLEFDAPEEPRTETAFELGTLEVSPAPTDEDDAEMLFDMPAAEAEPAEDTGELLTFEIEEEAHGTPDEADIEVITYDEDESLTLSGEAGFDVFDEEEEAAEPFFAAYLDEDELYDEDDELSPLQRFDMLIDADGTQPPLPDAPAPNFFDIVEEFVSPETRPQQPPAEIAREEVPPNPFDTSEPNIYDAPSAPARRMREPGGAISPTNERQDVTAEATPFDEVGGSIGSPRPDHHLLLIDAAVPRGWFFAAARRYWDAFQPTLISDERMLSTVPEEADIGITVIATPGNADTLAARLRDYLPHAHIDLVVPDTPTELRAELDRRAELDQPFGGTR